MDLVLPQFEGAEAGKIDRKSLTSWVVRSFIFIFLDWCGASTFMFNVDGMQFLLCNH